jgi:hypothetical protein
MATPKVYATVGTAYADVIGAAAAVAGVTWQNIGPGKISIAFTTVAPAEGATDAVHLLDVGEAFYDKNGSAHCWVKMASGKGARVCATAD